MELLFCLLLVLLVLLFSVVCCVEDKITYEAPDGLPYATLIRIGWRKCRNHISERFRAKSANKSSSSHAIDCESTECLRAETSKISDVRLISLASTSDPIFGTHTVGLSLCARSCTIHEDTHASSTAQTWLLKISRTGNSTV